MASAGSQVDVDLDAVEDQIYQPDADADDRRKLRIREKIFQVWPEPPSDDRLHVFVEVPSGERCVHYPFSLHYIFPRCLADNVFFFCCDLSCVFALDRSASQSLPGTPPAETRDLWPAVTINATSQGDFGGLAAVERNKIFELHGIEPVFLQEFRSKLGQPRWIEPDTVCLFKSYTTLVIEFCHRTHSSLRI